MIPMAETTPAAAAPVVIRAPNSRHHAAYTPPGLRFLTTTWHVTHSTLPMWRDKRNVTITYRPLEPSDGSPLTLDNTDRLDDLVTYQDLTSPADDNNKKKVSTVHGVDRAANEERDAWDWRGKGWLMIASSHWQVLGWGHVDGGGEGGGEGNDWVLTYFAKTLFTPAGIDIYSRSDRGLDPSTVQRIKDELVKVENSEVRDLAKGLFSVKLDSAQ